MNFRNRTALAVTGFLVVLTAACGNEVSTSAAPALVAVTDSEPVTINGTSVRVPGVIEGLGKPIQSRADRAASPGDAPPNVIFLKPGPMKGTISGSLTVAVRTDPAANKSLANLGAADGQATAASVLGQEDRATSVLRAGQHLVLKIASIAVIPGAELGYPDRVYHEYVFAGSDGGSVVSVATDVLPENEVLDYIAAITS